MYDIPLFDLNYDERETKAVTEVLESKWISNGPKCAELEKVFCDALSCKHAFCLANCTDALHLALLALGIGPGDEVIVPSLTFVATVNCVRYVGADPVFCDVVSKEDLTISPGQIEALISDRTKAIIVMHYGGFACDMDAIMAIAAKHGLRVVEDACHGPLSEYKGKKLGTIGDAGCFSFFSNKNISTGEGGMIVTNDDALAERMRLMRSHGMTTMSYQRAQGHSTKYDVVELGYNFRMDDIRAALGIVQMEKLPGDLKIRAKIRKRYEEKLAAIDGLIVPFKGRTEFSSNYIFPVVLKEGDEGRRDAVRNFLQEKGIQTSVHYPAAHRFSIHQDARKGDLTNTEFVTDCEFTLPMYAKLSDEQIDYICESVNKALEEN